MQSLERHLSDPRGETAQPTGIAVSGASGRDCDLSSGKQQLKAQEQIEASGLEAIVNTIQPHGPRMSLTFFIREGEAGGIEETSYQTPSSEYEVWFEST